MEWIGFFCVLFSGIYILIKSVKLLFENAVYRNNNPIDMGAGIFIFFISWGLLSYAWFFKPFTIVLH